MYIVHVSLRPIAAALALSAGLGCRGPDLGSDTDTPNSSTDPSGGSETEDEAPDGCEPWDDPPAVLGMGEILELNFVEVSEELGLIDTNYSPELWPPSCDPAGEGVVRTPCKMELQGGGAAVGDFDGDGWPDLYLTRLGRRDLLFRNALGEGGTGFVEQGLERGLVEEFNGNGAAWADVDGDGDLDLYVTSIEIPGRFWFYRNQLSELGEASFVEEGVERGLALDDGLPHFGFSIGVGDYDRDGWLDLHTSEWWPGGIPGSVGHHVRLLRNRGAALPGTYVDNTDEAGADMLMINPEGVYAFAPTFIDLDEDGWQDLAVTSDNGTSRLFWNEGDGTFSDGTPTAGVSLERNGMGSSFGDYDGDGHLDWYVTAIFSPSDEVDCGNPVCGAGGNRLYRSLGPRCFEELGEQLELKLGGWGWGASFWDPDNDGDLDLVEANGFSTPHGPPGDFFAGDPLRYWRNDSQTLGAAGFVERGPYVGLDGAGEGRGLVTFDYDRDGDEDLLVVDNGGPFGIGTRLYRNDKGNTNAWLAVELDGAGGNRAGVGARVELQREVGGPWQVRVIGVGGHFLGHGEFRAHFGLGPSEAPVAQLRVRWPGGEISELSELDPRQLVRVSEP